MNRRNVINANTDRSRIPGRRRNASFGPVFEPTARDLHLHRKSSEGDTEPLTQRPDSDDSQYSLRSMDRFRGQWEQQVGAAKGVG